jgi:Fe-S cluster assembly protein SufD
VTAFTPEASRALGGPEWIVARRLAALEALDLDAPPSSDEEIWRYSRVDDLVLDRWQPATSGAATSLGSIDGLAGRAAISNGLFGGSDLDQALESKGVVLGSLAALGADRPDLRDALGRVSGQSADWFTRLHDAFLHDAVVLHVPAGVVVDRPIEISVESHGDGQAAFPHVLVILGEGAEATVAERRHSGRSASILVSGVVELEVGDRAHLKYVALQDHGPQTWEVVHQRATIGRDATLRAAAIALGGDYARLRAETLLTGQGGSAEQVAVYFGRGTQMLDFRTLSDHDAPRTSSDLLFKGAVDDESRSVYSGLIHLRPTAQKASAHQTNRNLVLAPPPAGAESIPNLEIEANDVKCSHASTIGPIDEDQRYYLESRGVPPAVAERLIVEGFFEDVLVRLPVGPLGDPVRAAVTARFAAHAGAGVGAGA